MLTVENEVLHQLLDDLIVTFSDPKKFTQRVYARDDEGYTTSPDSPLAHCWCYSGRIRHFYYHNAADLLESSLFNVCNNICDHLHRLTDAICKKTPLFKQLEEEERQRLLKENAVDMDMVWLNDHKGREVVLEILKQAKSLLE